MFNYGTSSDYVQRQTDHGIVALSIIKVFRTASPGSLQGSHNGTTPQCAESNSIENKKSVGKFQLKQL